MKKRNSVPPMRSSPERMYMPGHWEKKSKEEHREWIWKKLSENARTILDKKGRLLPGLHFVSLTGYEMAETRWFLQHHPFFTPSQVLAVDYRQDEGKGSIDFDMAARLGVPAKNLFLDYPLKNALQMLRVQYKVAVINADLTCTLTMDTIRNELAPLVVSLKRCCDNVGECFLFFNTAVEILNSKSVVEESRETYKWLNSRKILDEYFGEQEYRDKNVMLQDIFTNRGICKTTRMFCFCLHLAK